MFSLLLFYYYKVFHVKFSSTVFLTLSNPTGPLSSIMLLMSHDPGPLHAEPLL